jgi:hypothetical protein
MNRGNVNAALLLVAMISILVAFVYGILWVIQ